MATFTLDMQKAQHRDVYAAFGRAIDLGEAELASRKAQSLPTTTPANVPALAQ